MKLIPPMVLLAILGASFSIYIYAADLAPKEKIATHQFRRVSASMRHHIKVSNLNHRAADTYLRALLQSDQEKVSKTINLMKASLGFIYSGYIDNSQYITHVVPIIEKTSRLLEINGYGLQKGPLSNIRGNYQRIFIELEKIEKNINIEVKQLYAQQRATKKQWQLFYLSLTASALLSLGVTTILAFRQRLLIKNLETNEQNLKIHIEERRQSEKDKAKLTDQLNQAKKMESIGLMVGGVAHDLNNILGGIVGYPHVILKKLPEDSELRQYVEALQDSGNRAALIIEDLLTVARGAATIKEDHNLNRMVKEYLSSPEFNKLQSLYPRITFKSEFEAETGWIFCSPVHVKKCIMNLVTNGAEAIVGPGTVTITVRNHQIDKSEKRYGLKKGDYVCLSVLDTGPGISDKDLKHIFDPFYSKKTMGRSGTGLGLTVVWNTMDDHGGRVLVENDNGGTRFRLCFPVGVEKEVVEEQETREERLVGNKEHILVVDDEKQLCDLAGHMLRDLNYTVDCVPSGEQAIEFIKKTRVDLLILDMLMEPGINGRKTYEEILKLFPGQRAIIASGFSESDDVRATLKLGAGEFIKKPYSADQLGRAVKATLTS
ncbi:MAG: ATP-binding protein [Thermodesulfobacteriota bacterium]